MYVVGVDGGTTKTIALVADDQGQVLSAVRGKGSNWAGEDVDIPMGVVAETTHEALQKAGLSGDVIEVGVFTLAGADWPEDHTRREAVLGKAGIAKRIVVKNDSFGGLRAGLTRPYGMVLAVGTGMNAAVITPTGQEWAFGYYETTGGAGTLTSRAFDAVMDAEHGVRKPTQLTQYFLDQLGYPTVEAMLRASVLRRVDRARYYSVTPLIFQAALNGDEVAVEILTVFGRELAGYASAMARKFLMTGLEFEVVLAGSVFKGAGPLLIDTITQEIHRVAPYAQIVRARYEPAVGSVLLAYDTLKIPITDAVYDRLMQTAPGPDFFDTAKGYRPTPMWQEDEE